MFNLDIQLFNYLYHQCRELGSAFGFGAFEGMILYTAFATWGITSVINAKKAKR